MIDPTRALPLLFLCATPAHALDRRVPLPISTAQSVNKIIPRGGVSDSDTL